MKEYKHLGLKLTPQRLAILEFLEGNKEHPSAAAIYEAVGVKFPTMSFATVYNTLRILRDKEKLLELSIDPEKKRYDPDTAPHHHLICTECGKIVDIFSRFEVGIPEEEQQGFEITGNHVDFYGLCPQCHMEKKG